MCAFIVNPPIRDDADYYRRDDHVVDAILAGASKLVIGLRRSGKTSFLLRVARAARARGLTAEHHDLADLDDEAAEALAAAPPDVLLLDEAEVLRGWDRPRLDRLLRAIRKAGAVVLSCAPQFLLELDQEPEPVQRLVEGLDRHVIGALTEDEARDLLAQRRRPPGPLSERQVAEGLARGERLAIILQAVGAQFAGTADAAVSLGGFGKRVLTGLTEPARRILVDAAYDQPVTGGPEADLLIATGALRRGEGGRIEIASELLAELVCAASPMTIPPPTLRLPQPRWERYARIVHLSDLHFGSHSIDPPGEQARRLIAALERDDRVPDFVAVTGDLSWSGHRRELRDAEQFLELLVDWLRGRRGWDDLEARRRIVVVPGNHEAAWALSNGIPSKVGAPTEDEIEHWVRYSLGPYANFVNRFYRGATFFDLDAPCFTLAFAEPSVAFVALSTSHYITQIAREATFGKHLLEHAVELMGRQDVQRARFRIGVWHHNLRPFQSQSGAITDVDVAVRGFLRARPPLDFALHGHVHQGEVEVFLPRGGNETMLPYSAVGSFGVVASHRPGDDLRGRVHNEIAIVELQVSGGGRRVQTEFYELRPDPDLVWGWARARTEKPRAL